MLCSPLMWPRSLFDLFQVGVQVSDQFQDEILSPLPRADFITFFVPARQPHHRLKYHPIYEMNGCGVSVNWSYVVISRGE